ncbi:MAG: hypothetical protein OXB92_09870 [Acidimicrobiaceae bacterium]|nr:hypothetical protein [Acidimicrobiia bacterium]MCY4494149.1 hypothetical protein [Acidimicrobiaceae bacterium]
MQRIEIELPITEPFADVTLSGQEVFTVRRAFVIGQVLVALQLPTIGVQPEFMDRSVPKDLAIDYRRRS